VVLPMGSRHEPAVARTLSAPTSVVPAAEPAPAPVAASSWRPFWLN
jgi:hypothetical protein